MSPDIGNNKQIAINLGKYQTFILKPEQHARNNKTAQIEYRLHSLLHCPEAEDFFYSLRRIQRGQSGLKRLRGKNKPRLQ